MTRITPKSVVQQEQTTWSSDLIIDKIRTLESPNTSCVAWCSCKCHIQQSLKTTPIINDIFGSLCVMVCGFPLLAKPCDQYACRRRSGPSFSVTYRSPPLLVQRVLSMSISLAGIRSPELRVKLPRVVDWTAPIWGPAIEGNADHARALFVRGEASPWDVNPIGGSVLHVS